jgi:hypothetical protein
MAQVTQELIDTLLREQGLEFSTEFSHVNHPLAAAIRDMPEAELLAAGEKLIESGAASQRILGIRLLRELRRPARQAAADLARLLRREDDDDVVYWIVSAFGFLRGDLVVGELTGLAAHEDPGIRYHVATAVSNLAADDLPEESRATLTALARDPDAEVRFSAVFELGTWWQANHDERIEAVLRTACSDSGTAVARTAQTALGEGRQETGPGGLSRDTEI